MPLKTPRTINPDFDVTPLGNVVVVDVANTSNVTASAVNATVVRLAADKDCHVVVGSAPTAQTTDTYLPKGAVERISLDPDDKIAVVRHTDETTDGHLFITNCDGYSS